MAKEQTIRALMDIFENVIVHLKSQPAARYVVYFSNGAMVCEPVTRGMTVHGWKFQLTHKDIMHGLSSKRWTELEIAFRELIERNKKWEEPSRQSQPTKLKNYLPTLPQPGPPTETATPPTETT